MTPTSTNPTHPTPPPRTRRRIELSHQQWRILGAEGGNVSALHRHLLATAPDPSAVVPYPVLLRTVRRELAAGRTLPQTKTLARITEVKRRTRQLKPTDLLLPTEDDTLNAATEAATKVAWLPPGGQAVHTAPLRAVTKAVAQAAASRTAVCVDGDTGRGKTVAVAAAVASLPRQRPAAWITAPVGTTKQQLRRALWNAMEIESPLPHRSAPADDAIAGALSQGHVVVIDEAQRLTPTCLEYLQGMITDPGCDLALVLSGTGSERAVRRTPALQISSWHQMPPLTAEEAVTDMPTFHPLWSTATAADIAWTNQHLTQGLFRMWATLTAHIHTALTTDPTAPLDRALLRRAITRLRPYE